MKIASVISKLVFFTLIAILAYTRFVGIDWGLPYSMHPDERNMVIAILQFTCHQSFNLDCLNPHFFAYGQFPLYLAYGMSLITERWGSPIPTFSLETVTLSLRLISAVSSLLTVFVLYRIATILRPTSTKQGKFILFLLLIFVPVFIQFAHFGTTESLLMLFVSVMVYLSLRFFSGELSLRQYIVLTGIVFGIAVGTKVSAALYASIPLFTLSTSMIRQRSYDGFVTTVFALAKIGAIGLIFFIISSPYNIIDWGGFVHSMNYESGVGIGTYKAFYTRSFEYTLPVVFQFIHIFPYALGWPLCIASILGFVLLPWDAKHNMLRFAFLLLFFPNAIMYAKWTRFLAPVYPLMVLFGVVFLLRVTSFKLRIVSLLRLLIAFVLMVPGVAYLAIYQNPDVRFVASQWIYEHLPEGAYILSETANVVDIPMPNPLVDIELAHAKRLHPISFNMYEIGNDPGLDVELADHLRQADYIFVPSRRIFWNHTCYIADRGSQISKHVYTIMDGYEEGRCQKLKDMFPLQNSYYEGLFSGDYGFEQVAIVTSYPRIELFGYTLLKFPDEAAEETWTVFDHPVIRVYKRI